MRVRTDPRSSSDLDISENFRTGADDDPVAYRRVSLLVTKARASEGHPLIDDDAISDDRRLSDHNSHPVINDHVAQNGARMNVNSGEEAGKLGDEPRQEWNSELEKKVRDPVKNIVFNASPEDVADVFVNGRQVLKNGRVEGADEARILSDLQAAGERMWPLMAEFDWGGRGIDELSPPTCPL